MAIASVRAKDHCGLGLLDFVDASRHTPSDSAEERSDANAQAASHLAKGREAVSAYGRIYHVLKRVRECPVRLSWQYAEAHQPRFCGTEERIDRKIAIYSLGMENLLKTLDIQ